MASAHPRRLPAHRSVSLRHHPHQTVAARGASHDPPSASPQTACANPRPSSSPSNLKPLVGKDDSGESSNAENWFDKSNENGQGRRTSFVDNSPPFFLQNSSSEENPQDPTTARDAILNGDVSGSVPMRAGLVHFGTDNSSTEDFRSVIDDLTIENKKLKRKLKSYQKLQDSHLKDQKLFEVRVHGLPTARKKELEELLRKFAVGLQGPPGANTLNAQGGPNVPSGLLHAPSGSSATSNPFADSAYASASASGQGSSSRSAPDNKKRFPSSSTARSRRQNIQTYLHDIPEGFKAERPPLMTDRSRKRVVVRRLEQIFAGKGAVSGNCQPQQQEEVSQSAARADRQQFFESRGHNAPLEGVREAPIMADETSGTANRDAAAGPGGDHVKVVEYKDRVPPVRKSAGPEQRPTRPLDLDPHRAQVPADNIDYIRHLGFSPKPVGSFTPPADGHGWIYLNLLANMAQLHTVNVTPDFVRRAVEDHSKKFELSNDGRKIRWKGGKTVTISSSDGDNSPATSGMAGNSMSSDRLSPRKKLKTSQQGSSTSGSKHPGEDKFAWTPLFHHRSNDDDSEATTSGDSSEEEDAYESAHPLQPTGESSGMASSGVKTTATKKSVRRDNGPIIFYNNARFCTDLSGDAKVEDAMLYNAFLYHKVGTQPVGTLVPAPRASPASAHGDVRGPLVSDQDLPEATPLDDNPVPSEKGLDFPEYSQLTSQDSPGPKAVRLEVSGLGGVYPADNFTISVKSHHARQDDEVASTTADLQMPRRYTSDIVGVLSGHPGPKARTAFHEQVLVTHREDHPPTQLPDASCFIPAGDTSPEDDDMEDADDVVYVTPPSPHAPAPSVAPRPIELNYDSNESVASEYDSDAESDGSLDLLAAARELDPENIRQREREYDAQLAERLAEEIPAGSSAATAGGGSGWATPASGVDRVEWERARKAARNARKEDKIAGLKRGWSEVKDGDE